jgi:predicted TPR repeat methyltransferase
MLGILRCNLLGIFEKFGEYYDLTYRETMNYKKDCDILENVFKVFERKPKSILDLGCGTGSHRVDSREKRLQCCGNRHLKSYD